jgi:hypothetical protein
MKSPTLPVIKRLFAKSGNKCAMPDCQAQLITDNGTVIGEICHIKAESPKGPRYDSKQTDEDRHGYVNLILMCPIHHKIIDTETRKYTTNKLLAIKNQHEIIGVPELSPQLSKAAQELFSKTNISVTNNAKNTKTIINSPGATIIETTKEAKPKILPPVGSISGNRKMLSYALYLIKRYQEFQKADNSKPDKKKYMIIHNALKNKFHQEWKLLPEAKFDEVYEFLQYRIDKTITGKINKARGARNYHSFEDHH